MGKHKSYLRKKRLLTVIGEIFEIQFSSLQISSQLIPLQQDENADDKTFLKIQTPLKNIAGCATAWLYRSELYQ
jgi:hypothetical protein